MGHSFLIEHLDGARIEHRSAHYPEGINPVLKPDRPWEGRVVPKTRFTGPFASPFSGGVWWEPREKEFRMYYRCGEFGSEGWGQPNLTAAGMCFANSSDGIAWSKPHLNLAMSGDHERLQATFLTGVRCSHRWRCDRHQSSW